MGDCPVPVHHPGSPVASHFELGPEGREQGTIATERALCPTRSTNLLPG